MPEKAQDPIGISVGNLPPVWVDRQWFEKVGAHVAAHYVGQSFAETGRVWGGRIFDTLRQSIADSAQGVPGAG